MEKNWKNFKELPDPDYTQFCNDIFGAPEAETYIVVLIVVVKCDFIAILHAAGNQRIGRQKDLFKSMDILQKKKWRQN